MSHYIPGHRQCQRFCHDRPIRLPPYSGKSLLFLLNMNRKRWRSFVREVIRVSLYIQLSVFQADSRIIRFPVNALYDGFYYNNRAIFCKVKIINIFHMIFVRFAQEMRIMHCDFSIETRFYFFQRIFILFYIKFNNNFCVLYELKIFIFPI